LLLHHCHHQRHHLLLLPLPFDLLQTLLLGLQPKGRRERRRGKGIGWEKEGEEREVGEVCRE
jgi:hypothetical protein